MTVGCMVVANLRQSRDRVTSAGKSGSDNAGSTDISASRRGILPTSNGPPGLAYTFSNSVVARGSPDLPDAAQYRGSEQGRIL
jgi:hypothetical protein